MFHLWIIIRESHSPCQSYYKNSHWFISLHYQGTVAACRIVYCWECLTMGVRPVLCCMQTVWSRSCIMWKWNCMGWQYQLYILCRYRPRHRCIPSASPKGSFFLMWQMKSLTCSEEAHNTSMMNCGIKTILIFNVIFPTNFEPHCTWHPR